MKLSKCYLCGSNKANLIHKGVRGDNNINVLQCKNCGLVRLSEVTDDVDDFYRTSGMREGESTILSELRKETMDDDERRFLFTEKMICRKSVLDFGCGDGGYLIKARQVADKVAGVELEKSMREALQEEHIICYERIDEAERYDVVTMYHVLEHLVEPISVLQDIKRHLKPQGKIIIEVPNADDALLSLYDNNEFANFTYWKCHVYLYTTETLRQLARQAGLEVEFIRQVQRYPLSNHLYWLSKGKPGGHVEWSFLSNPNLDCQYGELLANLGIADTIIASMTFAQ